MKRKWSFPVIVTLLWATLLPAAAHEKHQAGRSAAPSSPL